MLSHLTLALLVATGASPRAVKIAAPGLSGVNLPDALVRFYSEQLAEHLRDNGIEVVTGREMAALMGLERQRQLIGCAADSTNCLAELANALGVDRFLLGDGTGGAGGRGPGLPGAEGIVFDAHGCEG